MWKSKRFGVVKSVGNVKNVKMERIYCHVGVENYVKSNKGCAACGSVREREKCG